MRGRRLFGLWRSDRSTRLSQGYLPSHIHTHRASARLFVSLGKWELVRRLIHDVGHGVGFSLVSSFGWDFRKRLPISSHMQRSQETQALPCCYVDD